MSERVKNKALGLTKTGLNTFQLKILAAIAMLCSHFYKCILVGQSEFIFLDIIGRIAFPIYCFVLVEGFCHTSNRKKYLLRLWIGAVLSEIPFDLAFFGRIYEPASQNVLFTMVIGLCVLVCMEKCKGMLKMIPVSMGMIVAWFLHVDYEFYGIWIIVLFYLFRGMKKELWSIQAGSFLAATAFYGWIQAFSLLALPFLAVYNGQKGKDVKSFFYIFYPMHLLFLISFRLF